MINQKWLHVLFTITFLLIFGTTARSQMLADITEPIETDFGTYRPYNAVFFPRVPVFSVEPDFTNVSNFSDITGRQTFSSQDSLLLSTNFFTVKKTRFTKMFDIYNDNTWSGTPVFVTTDAVLHIYHVLFDRILSDIEVQHFVDTLSLLTDTMSENTQSVYAQAEKSETKEAALKNLAFFSVAKKLLEGADAAVPDEVRDMVAYELDLIDSRDGFHNSSVFGNFSKLDYSQFQPRGHYTKNETLTAYFKTMMWYGSMIFTMEPGLFGDTARCHTLQALLLVQMLYTLEAGGLPLIELWEKIYEPTVFFVGKTDDPNVKDYRQIADSIYGSGYLTLSPDNLAGSALLDKFMSEAQKLPEPKIPNWIYGTFVTYKGFRFMGQRFIPDSYMFAHLVEPYVERRFFPKGLDVMAILGSDRAYELLGTFYKETSYKNYPEKISEFKSEFTAKAPENWAQNLYWNWLYCLMPLFYEKGEGYPVFMQTDAWSDKELLTALASWAELRHDTILYAKQSMTPLCIPPGPPKSYVEPNPHLYARLAALARYTREGLASRGILPAEYTEKLELFETLLIFLRDISIKELTNVPLSDAEYENIYCFGKVMEDLVVVPSDPEKPWKGDTGNMAVIADVHTDSNSDRCLEEGVGYPLEIYVIVSEGGTIRMTRGAVFSCYEFTQPIAERLTDETWRKMLEGSSPPSMPKWTANFMDATAQQPSYYFDSPKNLFMGNFTSVDSEEDILPETVTLSRNYPNPFNPETTIPFSLPERAYITLTVYNILGQKIITLFEGNLDAGFHTVVWNGRDAHGCDVSTGIYLCAVRAADNVRVMRMALIR